MIMFPFFMAMGATLFSDHPLQQPQALGQS